MSTTSYPKKRKILTEINSQLYQELPLLAFTKDLHLNNTDLKNVYLIAQQHIVPTTYKMFQVLFDLGLNPQNLSVIGKCYSTDMPSFQQLEADGIHICKSSGIFNSWSSFDAHYNKYLTSFLKECKIRIANKGKEINKVIILDDGGDLLIKSTQILDRGSNIIGIEQTSSGYTKLKNHEIIFPIINIARCKAKLEYESTIISELSIRRLFARIKKFNKSIKKILIIGGGVIGSYLYNILKTKYNISIYDKNKSISSIAKSEFELSLNQFDLIIGCSGSKVFQPKHFEMLKNNALLVSVSSSDREFNAVHLRRQIAKTSDCHEDIVVNGIHLLNGGFPITFDSHYDLADQILLKKLELTRSLILSGICQASVESQNYPQFVAFDKKIQKKIIAQYLSIYSDN